ncbi:MAG: NADH-quinone oxidoreductase subunit C [Promethearchaeota archaeon]
MPAQPEIFIEKAKDSLKDLIISAEVKTKNQVELIVKKENILEVANLLKLDMGFTYPSAAGGMDYIDDNRMQMIYYIQNPDTGLLLLFKVNIPRENPVLPTMTQVWDAMSFHEREANEMFGIEFEGHKYMRPFLLPPDWKGGHPLRKDFKGEGITE